MLAIARRMMQAVPGRRGLARPSSRQLRMRHLVWMIGAQAVAVLPEYIMTISRNKRWVSR
jgi:hypothetical protein